MTEVSGAAGGVRVHVCCSQVSPSQQLLQSLRLVDDTCWLEGAAWLHPGGARRAPMGGPSCSLRHVCFLLCWLKQLIWICPPPDSRALSLVSS